MRINLLGIMLLISFMGQLKSEEVIITHTSSNTFDETPTLDYNLATQEFTIDFGEVDEISGGRVVIHDDSGGYQVHKWIDKRPVYLYEQPRQHKTAQDGQQIRGLIK